MSLLLETFHQAAPALLAGMLRASVQGGIFILLIWIACRMFPRIPASVRCTLWWLATLKLVVTLAWIAPVPVRVLPAAPAPSLLATLPIAGQAGSVDAGLSISSGRTGASTSLASAVVVLWLAAALILCLIAGYRVSRILKMALRAGSAPPGINSLAIELSTLIGLTRIPDVRISEEIDTPLVIRFFRRLVLLPAGSFLALSPVGRRMALYHELVHLRRRDPWLAALPALAERLFFFHPLAHLAVREYGLAREAACDAEVLRELDVPPAEYGTLLLTLGVARTSRHFAAAGASHSYSTLKRRIIMLGYPARMGKCLRVAAVGLTVLAVLAIIPVKFVARPVEASATHWAPPISAARLPLAAHESLSAIKSAAEAQVAQAASTRAEELKYVFFVDDNARTMSGSEAEVARAGQFRKPGERMLWFRHNGREYVVRDPGVLAEVEQIFKPLEDIGRKQGEIGARQGEIGARQGMIGRKQGEIGAKQGDIGARQSQIAALRADLAARQAALAAARLDGNQSAAQARELERSSRELEAQMQVTNAQMKELSAQMRSLNEPMIELGEQMKGLSREMEALSRHMKEVSAKANNDFRSLVDRAIAKGTAIEVKENR